MPFSSRRELEVVHRDRDALLADAEEAAEIDEHGVDLAVLGEDEVANLGDLLVVGADDAGADQLFGGERASTSRSD